MKKTSQKYTARAKEDTKLYVLNQSVFQALENEYFATEKDLQTRDFAKISSKRRAVYQTSSTIQDVSSFIFIFFVIIFFLRKASDLIVYSRIFY